MRVVLGRTLRLAVLCGAVALCGAIAGQETAGQPAARPDSSADDEVVVYGSILELRRQLVRARDAMFARFNEINSDHRLDIHCYSEVHTGSLLKTERCVSNAWKEEDANMGGAFVREYLGDAAVGASFYLGLQIAWQAKLNEEWARLANQDAAFAETVKRYAVAKSALEGVAPPILSKSSDAAPTNGASPQGATRVLDVTAGRKPWTHQLDTRAFTVAAPDGGIHGLTVTCEHAAEQRLEYQPNLGWRLPSEYGACRLQVDAARGTNFALYEFP
jgi:hypothetical protein